MSKFLTTIIPVLLLSFFITPGHNQQSFFQDLTGPYLGQKPPSSTPELFAPGVISTGISEGCSGWGNNMEFFIFQKWIDGNSKHYIMNQIDGIWSKAELLPFFDKYQVGDFTIAPDGKTMIFASNIVIDEIGSDGEGGNIWIIEKTETGWTEPKHIGLEINTKYHDSYPCLAGNKNLYFFSRRPGGYGDSDLYISEFINGIYQKPVNLGQVLNTKHHEYDTYISPDEDYMIFCSTKPEGLGSDDLYITFRQNDGSWCNPVHMGDKINSEKSENRPYVSPDGRYFFYTSTIRGNRDIYWVDSKIIKELKPKELKSK
ncbi:MAG: PD40 domain-containing protein [Bacteroidales bacterium]|nr:MAG: PD40 domain-containing protein [Bacteroidales bacterium]